jgi:hypothetical protein
MWKPKFFASWTPREWTELILTAIIGFFTLLNALAAIAYYSTYKKSVAATGQQSDQLIRAAQIQANAAEKMAVSSSAQAVKMTELAAQATAQATSTNLLAQQAKRSADIANEILQVSREASQEDRRAWVSAEIGEKEGRFFIAMHNTGKTPALKVSYFSVFATGKLGGVPKVDLSVNSLTPIDTTHMPANLLETLKKEGVVPDHPLSGFVIAPGKSEISSYFGGQFDRLFRFPADERIYIQGRFTYNDIFGKPHETRFCYWYAAESEFPMCADNNFMN